MHFSVPLLANSRNSANKGQEQSGNKDAGNVGFCRHRSIGTDLQPAAADEFSNTRAVEYRSIHLYRDCVGGIVRRE